MFKHVSFRALLLGVTFFVMAVRADERDYAAEAQRAVETIAQGEAAWQKASQNPLPEAIEMLDMAQVELRESHRREARMSRDESYAYGDIQGGYQTLSWIFWQVAEDLKKGKDVSSFFTRFHDPRQFWQSYQRKAVIGKEYRDWDNGMRFLIEEHKRVFDRLIALRQTYGLRDIPTDPQIDEFKTTYGALAYAIDTVLETFKKFRLSPEGERNQLIAKELGERGGDPYNRVLQQLESEPAPRELIYRLFGLMTATVEETEKPQNLSLAARTYQFKDQGGQSRSLHLEFGSDLTIEGEDGRAYVGQIYGFTGGGQPVLKLKIPVAFASIARFEEMYRAFDLAKAVRLRMAPGIDLKLRDSADEFYKRVMRAEVPARDCDANLTFTMVPAAAKSSGRPN